MAFFERDNFRMHYEVLDGALPYDTIFLHGNLASNYWWQPLFQELASQNKKYKGRAILAEWRGCGKSSGPELEKDLSLAKLANDYNELLDHLGITEAHLVGHSTGGLIGLYAMHARPDLYRKAVLLDPVSAQGVKLAPEILTAFKTMSQDRNLCAQVILSTIHGGCPEHLKNQIVEDAFHVHPLIWQGVPRMLDGIDFRSSLTTIPHPVLVLHGEQDQILPKDGSLEIAKTLLRGRFYEIPGRGHCTNIEDPKLFWVLIDPFLYG